MRKFIQVLALLSLSTVFSRGDVNGLMEPYSAQGTYPIVGGQAKIVIDKDAQGHFQYQIVRANKSGERTGGNPDFIKNSAFFVFPQDSDHYWIYDGRSDVIHFVFSDHGMTAESLSCVPSHFRAMPSEAVALLPKMVQNQMKL